LLFKNKKNRYQVIEITVEKNRMMIY
jgi:hypothetical protein